MYVCMYVCDQTLFSTASEEMRNPACPHDLQVNPKSLVGSILNLANAKI